MSHHATARQRRGRGAAGGADADRDDGQSATAAAAADEQPAAAAHSDNQRLIVDVDADDEESRAAAAASPASATSATAAAASPCRPQRRAAAEVSGRMRALALEQSQPLRHIQLAAAPIAAAAAASPPTEEGKRAGPSDQDEPMHDDGRDERKGGGGGRSGSDDDSDGGGSSGSDADSDSDTGAVDDADEEQSASESPPPSDDNDDYAAKKPRAKSKAAAARRPAGTPSTPPRRYMKRPVTLNKAECKSAEREHFGKLTTTKKGSTAWALFENVAAAAQARKKKAEAAAAAAAASVAAATDSMEVTPPASACKRRSGHVKLFASTSSPPLAGATPPQLQPLSTPTAKRVRGSRAAADEKEDEPASASSAASSAHERSAKRRRRSSNDAAVAADFENSESEDEAELMAQDGGGTEASSTGAAAAAASSTPVEAVQADPADSMIMQLIDIADDSSRSGVFAAVLELSEQRLAHIINLQSPKDGATFLQRLYRCFSLKHGQSINAHVAKLLRVINKHADWSLANEHRSTLLHTLSDAATYQYKTRHWNRNRYRWIDGHAVLQPDEPVYVFRDHDENRSRAFTFDLVRIACDKKLDLTTADDKGVIPLLSFPRLVLENKMSASKFRHLLMSRPPFNWHFRDADGRTLLHVFFSPRRPRPFDSCHPARRFIEKLVSDRRLLRQLDLLAGDKDGHSLISRAKHICGEFSPVPMNLMRAWQFERASTTRRILCDWMIPDLANICFEYTLGVPVRDKHRFTDEASEAIFRVRATAELMEAERAAAAAAAEAAGQPAAAAAPAQPAHPPPPPHAAHLDFEPDFDSDMSGDEWDMLEHLYGADHHHDAEAVGALDEDDEAMAQPAAAAAAAHPAPVHAHAHRSKFGSIDAFLISKPPPPAHAATQTEGDDELEVLDHAQAAEPADPVADPPAAPAAADEPVPMDIE